MIIMISFIDIIYDIIIMMMMIRSYLGHREDHQPVQVAGPNGEVGQTGPCQLERLEVQSGILEVRGVTPTVIGWH